MASHHLLHAAETRTDGLLTVADAALGDETRVDLFFRPLGKLEIPEQFVVRVHISHDFLGNRRTESLDLGPLAGTGTRFVRLLWGGRTSSRACLSVQRDVYVLKISTVTKQFSDVRCSELLTASIRRSSSDTDSGSAEDSERALLAIDSRSGYSGTGAIGFPISGRRVSVSLSLEVAERPGPVVIRLSTR